MQQISVLKNRYEKSEGGVVRVRQIINDYITGTAYIEQLGGKVSETMLRWFGQVQRKDSGYYIGQEDAEYAAG